MIVLIDAGGQGGISGEVKTEASLVLGGGSGNLKGGREYQKLSGGRSLRKGGTSVKKKRSSSACSFDRLLRAELEVYTLGAEVAQF